MSELVTIIMPVYNGELFIREAIDSVLAQTHPHWDLVVVDDGSTDGTAQIVTSFGDVRIRYVYQENQGQAAALNHGLKLTRGDYVTTLDADDWLLPESLSDRVVCLDRNSSIGAAYADGYYCDGEGRRLAAFADYRPGNLTGDIYDVLIRTNLLSAGSAVMIRREILEHHSIRYDESLVWCQDWDLYIRVAEYTTFGYVDAPAMCYRLQPDNMTMSMPAGRRLASVIRTGWKAMSSPRFARVALSHKEAFFQSFLTQTLLGHVEEQNKVLASEQFQTLPREVRGRLLRLTATSHLIQGGDGIASLAWLNQAQGNVPADAKARTVSLLLRVHPALARGALRARRALRPSRRYESPLEMITIEETE